MPEKLATLIEKVEKLLDLHESLKEENLELKDKNHKLIRELNKFRKEFDLIKVNSADKNERVRSKLTGIVERLEKLEELAS